MSSARDRLEATALADRLAAGDAAVAEVDSMRLAIKAAHTANDRLRVERDAAVAAQDAVKAIVTGASRAIRQAEAERDAAVAALAEVESQRDAQLAANVELIKQRNAAVAARARVEALTDESVWDRHICERIRRAIDGTGGGDKSLLGFSITDPMDLLTKEQRDALQADLNRMAQQRRQAMGSAADLRIGDGAGDGGER